MDKIPNQFTAEDRERVADGYPPLDMKDAVMYTLTYLPGM
jgi:hypothetical protein